jgi:hypothetical protein
MNAMCLVLSLRMRQTMLRLRLDRLIQAPRRRPCTTRPRRNTNFHTRLPLCLILTTLPHTIRRIHTTQPIQRIRAPLRISTRLHASRLLHNRVLTTRAIRGTETEMETSQRARPA